MKRDWKGTWKGLIGTILVLFLIAGTAFAGTTATSGITATTIASRAQVYLNAASDPFFTATDFVQWIDEAVRETINRTNCTETTAATVTLSTSTASYSIGQSFLKVVAVEHDNGDSTDQYRVRTLDRTRLSDTGHNDAKGRPQVYDIWNNKIQVWPIPTSDYNNTSLYVYTVPLPTGVSQLSSSIETPAYLDVALLYYVVAQAHYKNRMMSNGDKFMAMWEKRLAEYSAIVLQRKPIE